MIELILNDNADSLIQQNVKLAGRHVRALVVAAVSNLTVFVTDVEKKV